MKKQKNKKERILDRLLDVPEEVASGEPKITILSFKKMLLENYIAILEYQDFYIRVKTKIGIININGFTTGGLRNIHDGEKPVVLNSCIFK